MWDGSSHWNQWEFAKSPPSPKSHRDFTYNSSQIFGRHFTQPKSLVVIVCHYTLQYMRLSYTGLLLLLLLPVDIYLAFFSRVIPGSAGSPQKSPYIIISVFTSQMPDMLLNYWKCHISETKNWRVTAMIHNITINTKINIDFAKLKIRHNMAHRCCYNPLLIKVAEQKSTYQLMCKFCCRHSTST